MSNTLSIAAVTGVFGARLSTHLSEAGLTFSVINSHPTDADAPGTYLHLYNIMPNAALRNEPLPERTAAGDVRTTPRLSVDLYYQLTFVGVAVSYDIERMAGACMTGLHAFPRFSPEEITAFLAAQGGGSVLAAADLSDQLEQVRVTPLSADIEDLSRLWGMTQRGYHRLSVLYRASAVVLEPDIRRATPLPVTSPAVTVYPLRQPRIEEVLSSARRLPVVVFGESVVIRGQALRGDGTEIVLGDQRLAPDTEGDTELRAAFGAGMQAGVYALQVRHRITLESGETRDGAESNTAPVALAPALDAADFSSSEPSVGAGEAARTEVRLTPQPIPASDQSIELSLVEVGGDGRHSSSSFSIDGTELVVTLPQVPAGSYLVRLRVDGATSVLDTDGSGNFTGPVLVVA